MPAVMTMNGGVQVSVAPPPPVRPELIDQLR
jgi:hypothetical protein